jgi:flagellar basal body-associated protein FliL
MNRSDSRTGSGFIALCLGLVLGALVLFIAVGSIWSFATGRARPGASSVSSSKTLFDNGKKNPAPAAVSSSDVTGKTAVFPGIGLLRAATADKKPVTIVVSPFIPYPSDDIPFGEELVSKTMAMRASVTGWFRARTIKEIKKLGEAGVKKQLIDAINSHLVLGKISSIYFEEYLVLE